MSKRNNTKNADLSAAELLTIAETKTRRLKPFERQKVLAHLDEVGDIRSTAEMAALFGVSEAIIQRDQHQMLAVVAQVLTPDQAMTFVAHALRQYRLLQNIAIRGIAANKRGTEGERKYSETLVKVISEELKLLTDIGLIRPELAKQNQTEEHWVATVNTESGECGVHAASPEDDATPTKAEADINEQAPTP